MTGAMHMVAVKQPRSLHHWETTLTAVPAAASTARRMVRSVLRGWGWDNDRASELVLIASELVTNVVRHAGGPRRRVGLELQEVDGDCRIEILDYRPDLPLPETPVARGECGRGLILVRELADDMGVVTTATTKNVWARVLLAADDTPRHTP
ncbi:ATP-binding protein [Kitasatospora sp. NPDC091276]|uniref:ATP-binding protein n=1 Tax=Kitasatospora sp. NPDC091276 TaxID=3155300 RepID=UPI00343E58B0